MAAAKNKTPAIAFPIACLDIAGTLRCPAEATGLRVVVMLEQPERVIASVSFGPHGGCGQLSTGLGDFRTTGSTAAMIPLPCVLMEAGLAMVQRHGGRSPVRGSEKQRVKYP